MNTPTVRTKHSKRSKAKNSLCLVSVSQTKRHNMHTSHFTWYAPKLQSHTKLRPCLNIKLLLHIQDAIYTNSQQNEWIPLHISIWTRACCHHQKCVRRSRRAFDLRPAASAAARIQTEISVFLPSRWNFIKKCQNGMHIGCTAGKFLYSRRTRAPCSNLTPNIYYLHTQLAHPGWTFCTLSHSNSPPPFK